MSIPDGASREELLAAVAERDAVIAALLVRIEVLERRVGMDSSNSSMPPGSDGPAARARRAKQRKSKPSPNPRGGQPGHVHGHDYRAHLSTASSRPCLGSGAKSRVSCGVQDEMLHCVQQDNVGWKQ